MRHWLLAPETDNAPLGADPQRNNDFNYAKMDPHGYAAPLGTHVRRMNPRGTAANMNRHRMIRRGGTYGPYLPEDAPDDGVERGIAAFIGCASLVRQFEFAQNVWANDRNFHELGNERDPIIGAEDGTLEYKIPKRPIRKKEASPDEIEAVRRWLTREGTVLVLGPHHDVGVSMDMSERAMEYAHHGDPLVPRQQRFGKHTRSLMRGLGVPIENRYGLRPGVIAGTSQIAPLTINRDLDTRGWLNGVTNFSFHKHLPHYAVITEAAPAVHVLARQPIDLSRPHPFTEDGNREFNSFVWMPPAESRAGEILLADSTIFSTLFGADESLKRFWKNLATASLTRATRRAVA